MKKKAKRLRILSYNVHKGFSSGNLRFVLSHIRESIRLVNADLVFLQEIVGHHEVHKQKVKDWPTTSQFEFLADKMWPHFAYGKNAIYISGHHGNAILSKFPITQWENIDVSTNKFEQRGILHAAVDVDFLKHPLHALCVHFNLFESGRAAQAQLLCHRIQKAVPKHSPLVICGDFNDWRERVSKPLEDLLHVKEAHKSLHGSHARTFPSWMPALRLDRIYVRGFEILEAHCHSGAPWNNLSDHAALFSELACR